MSRFVRAMAALSCLLLVSGLGVAATSPAAATSTLLCEGYDGCRSLGMRNDGYKLASGSMWWRMYAGHNCTNYAAFRMVKSGLPNQRPWDGGGNASYWGHLNARLTNSTPRVGAIAWWDAYVSPAGSSGHVAYVEKVVSADEIIVSQDSWNGDFSWARITRVGGRWPSGFVHFNDVPLRNTARPTVTGAPKVGELLTASTGSWTPAAGRYRYRWRASGVDLANANRRSLRLTSAELGKRISVRVTASKLGYPTTAATSRATAVVDAGVLSNTSPPTVSGEPRVGSTLTASPGAWTPAPAALAYQWAADGVPITGATTPAFTPGRAMVGKALSVTVIATRSSYADVSSSSVHTAPIAPGTITLTSIPTLTGTPRPGETLSLDAGGFRPARAEASVQWTRAGVPIEGATESTYQPAYTDLGSRIGARVTLTRAGYTPLTTRAQPTRRVRSVPLLQVRIEPGPGRLRVTVGLTAEGVRRVTGTVRVRSRGRVLKELALRRGTATATIRGLPKGRQTFRIRYLGGRTTTATTVTRVVRIR